MADRSSFVLRLVESVLELPGHFADVAAHDPVSAVLLGVGTLFVAVSVGVLGYLSVGAFFSLFTADRRSNPRREAR